MDKAARSREINTLLSELERHYKKHGNLNTIAYPWRASLNDLLPAILQNKKLHPRLKKIGIMPSPMLYLTAYWKKNHRFPPKEQLQKQTIKFIRKVMTDPEEKYKALKLRRMGCTLFEKEYNNCLMKQRSELHKTTYISPEEKQQLSIFDRLVSQTSEHLFYNGYLHSGTIEYTFCHRWERMNRENILSVHQKEILQKYKMIDSEGNFVEYKEKSGEV